MKPRNSFLERQCILPYWHRFCLLQVLQRTAAHTHRTQDAHREGSLQHEPFFYPDRKYESLGQGHHDKTVILGTACSYNIDN